VAGDALVAGPYAQNGTNAIRIMDPCSGPADCVIFEQPNSTEFSLAKPRWYPSTVRIFDGSIMIIGGIVHLSVRNHNYSADANHERFPR